MSNGQLGAAEGPWAEIKFDPATLMGAVEQEHTAVENAQGNVKAANERLREEVIAAQKAVQSAKENLSDRQRDVLEVLKGLGLINRTIDFVSGTCFAAVDLSEPESPHLEPKSIGENLAGSGGIITDVEAGTFLGKPIEPADAIVFFVDMDDAKGDLMYAGLPGYRYAVIANRSDYITSEVPQPDEQ